MAPRLLVQDALLLRDVCSVSRQHQSNRNTGSDDWGSQKRDATRAVDAEPRATRLEIAAGEDKLAIRIGLWSKAVEVCIRRWP